MSAPPHSNNFEGGTNGVAIATDLGATSGDAFDVVTATQPTYSNVQKRGNMAMCIVGDAAVHHVDWNSLGALTSATDLYIRFYMWLSALPTGNHHWPIRLLDNGAGSAAFLRILATSGYVGVCGWDAATIGTNGTVAVAINQWVRIEARFRASITDAALDGQAEFKLFNTPDSTSPDDTKGSGSGRVGTVANIDRCYLGQCNTPTPTNTPTVYYDDFAIATSGWIGPSDTSQKLRPDADLDATGWSTAPLFSKLNDQSNATVVTSTI